MIYDYQFIPFTLLFNSCSSRGRGRAEEWRTLLMKTSRNWCDRWHVARFEAQNV